ncbi:hypothetical protein GCM10027445_12020 [Amycolatopsis endophytica]|uniref:Uncharacterized protein n=1 Tax=Amycolatopsis endophytica TaxID=860233 RepID=A0A853B2J3_9PSEU|nr:hypothetical protein [Amycolatopsis endophytica]NYI89338.1 hypothetical protein [Amycolatopsis endophytica]
MTIYSQHPQRGKVQILACYRAPCGVVSSTVTSVDSALTAAPIVDALNQISACASVPVSVYDMRGSDFNHYPTGHLAALTDRDARASLLEGTHSLWYEQVMWVLHEALTDLDDATVSVPAPIRMAIDAELETEARWLRAALAEYREGVEVPDDETQRVWHFEDPFVAYDGGWVGLGRRDREILDRLEADATGQELDDAIVDLRLLLDVYAQLDIGDLQLQLDDLSIIAEPENPDGFFLNVEAPLPSGKYNRVQWGVAIDRWEADERDDEGYPTDSHGEPVIRCVLTDRPSITDVVALLKLATSQEQLEIWTRTPVGETLANTAFAVTKRYNHNA